MHLQRIRRDRTTPCIACLVVSCISTQQAYEQPHQGTSVLQRVLRPPTIRTYSSHSRHQSCEHHHATWSATARTNTVVCVHFVTEICSRTQGKQLAHLQQLFAPSAAVSTRSSLPDNHFAAAMHAGIWEVSNSARAGRSSKAWH